MEKVDYRCVTCVSLSHLYIFTSRICVWWFLVSLQITGGVKIRSFQWTNPSSSPIFGLKFSFYQFTGFWFIFLNSGHVFFDHLLILYMWILFLFQWWCFFCIHFFFCFLIVFFTNASNDSNDSNVSILFYYYIYIEYEVWIFLYFMCMFQSVLTLTDRTVSVRESDILYLFQSAIDWRLKSEDRYLWSTRQFLDARYFPEKSWIFFWLFFSPVEDDNKDDHGISQFFTGHIFVIV